MTFGLPVAAPSGTLTFTERLAVLNGAASIRPPPAALKRTPVTCPRWRPLSSTFEFTVAL